MDNLENVLLTNADSSNLAQPDLSQIVSQIKAYSAQIKENYIEIGNLLNVAKQSVSHGEWSKWLADNIEFSVQTANKCMKISRYFSNYAPARNLNSSQLFELVSLSESEAKKFIEVNDENGTPISDLPKRLLREKIKSFKNPNSNSDNDFSNTSNLQKLDKLYNLLKDVLTFEDLENLSKAYSEKFPDKCQDFIDKSHTLHQTLSQYFVKG